MKLTFWLQLASIALLAGNVWLALACLRHAQRLTQRQGLRRSTGYILTAIRHTRRVQS